MKNYTKTKSSSGISKEIIDHESLEIKGIIEEAVADNAVITTEIEEVSGLVSVIDETNGNSALFALVDTAGTVSVVQLVTNANFSLVANTDTKINVYLVGGALTIQNMSGGAIDIRYKAVI